MPTTLPSIRAAMLAENWDAVAEWLLLRHGVGITATAIAEACKGPLKRLRTKDNKWSDGTWDMWLRVSKGYEFAYVDEQLLSYRIGHPGQLTSNVERSVQCSDLILDRFIQSNPGIVPTELLKKALAYSYCRRGNLLRRIDRKRSTELFLGALAENPVQINAYLGLLKNILSI